MTKPESPKSPNSPTGKGLGQQVKRIHEKLGAQFSLSSEDNEDAPITRNRGVSQAFTQARQAIKEKLEGSRKAAVQKVEPPRSRAMSGEIEEKGKIVEFALTAGSRQAKKKQEELTKITEIGERTTAISRNIDRIGVKNEQAEINFRGTIVENIIQLKNEVASLELSDPKAKDNLVENVKNLEKGYTGKVVAEAKANLKAMIEAYTEKHLSGSSEDSKKGILQKALNNQLKNLDSTDMTHKMDRDPYGALKGIIRGVQAHFEAFLHVTNDSKNAETQKVRSQYLNTEMRAFNKLYAEVEREERANNQLEGVKFSGDALRFTIKNLVSVLSDAVKNMKENNVVSATNKSGCLVLQAKLESYCERAKEIKENPSPSLVLGIYEEYTKTLDDYIKSNQNIKEKSSRWFGGKPADDSEKEAVRLCAMFQGDIKIKIDIANIEKLKAPEAESGHELKR